MILITGGNGFIGREIMKQINLDCISLDLSNPEGVERLYRGGTLDTELLEDLFRKFQFSCVIHLGMTSLLKDVKNDQDKAKLSIVEGTRNIISVMKKHSCNRLIFMSTSMVYGNYYNKVVNEDSLCQPSEPYGRFKLIAEDLVKLSLASPPFEYIIIRPTAVYGKNDGQKRVLSKMIENAKCGKLIEINGKETALDFTHVSEVASAIITSALKTEIKNETFNISRGKRRSLIEVVMILKKYFPGTKFIINDKEKDKPVRGEINVEKAHNLLGFEPKIEIEDGIKMMLDGEVF